MAKKKLDATLEESVMGEAPLDEAPQATQAPYWAVPLMQFSWLMDAQLMANSHKPGWDGETPAMLLTKARTKFDKIREDVVQKGYTDPTVCADLANYMMMIADLSHRYIEQAEAELAALEAGG
ncbi:MAG: hypothetical protein C4521_02785 [Actinobacteria bacterium]|nr:MAG: hypothetical protein C4521_02785 [Actinomycetota bacterium]